MDITQIRREIINRVIGIEGAYVNDARDSGGKTKYGITAATAQKHGITDMHSISPDVAAAIYKADYWDVLQLDNIAPLSAEIAEELFEQGVNMGNTRAAEWLQRMLNTLNLNGRRFADVAPDGNIGAETIAALTTYLRWRGKTGERVLLNGLNAYQSTFYFDLAGKREKDEAFTFGWQANRVDETAVKPAEIAPLNPTPAPVLYYIQDDKGQILPVQDKAQPSGEPDSYVREGGVTYPLYVYKPPKPPLMSRDALIESGIHGGLWSIAAAGASAVLGADIGITPDVGAAVAAGGGIGSLLLFGAKQAAKFGAKLLAARLQGGANA